MGEMENLAEFYYEKLKTSVNPGIEIAHLFSELVRETGRADIIMINKLIKLFGRFTVYFAVMDLSKAELNKDINLYPYLYTICKSRFERVHGAEVAPAMQSLAREVTRLEKNIELLKKSKIKIPSSEGLN